MPQRILGIDVGTWSVKGVILEDRFRGFRVVRVHEARIGESQAEEGEPDDRRARVVAAVEHLLAEEEEKVDATLAAMPGERSTVRFVALPYSDQKKIDLTMGGELADLLPFDVDEACHDHELINKSKDGGSLSVAAASQFEHVEDYLGVLQEAGADPKQLGLDALDLFNLYTHFLKDDASKAEEPAQPAADAGTFVAETVDGLKPARLLVDVGHARTLVCACAEDGIAYARTLRAGGEDVTNSMVKTFNLELDAAETLKHEEGFVASSRHPAPDERAQRIGEVVGEGLSPLVRELRRTLQTIRSEKRVRIARVDLLGGGARIRNLANYLAEQLNVPVAPGLAVEQIVEPYVDQARRGAYAAALSHALRMVGDEPTSSIDLRVGAYAFAGQLQHLRQRLPAIFIAGAAIFLLLLVNVWSSYHTASNREAAIDRQFCSVTKDVIGREICEPTVAIAAMKEPASEFGNVKLPVRSALNIAAELSSRVPKDVKTLVIKEMKVTSDKASISGETDSFDSVDKIVTEYGKDPCYTNIKKGKMRRLAGQDRIEFLLSMRLECS